MGTFSLVGVPMPGVSLEDVEAGLDQVIAEFLKAGPDADDFARIKTQIRASQIYARDDVDGLARRYGEALATGLGIQDVQDWPGVLEAVTPEDVTQAAAEILDRDHAVTGWLMPEEVGQ